MNGRPIEDDIYIYRKPGLPKLVTYIGECCQEWVLAAGFPVGRCGYCGERPTYKRDDEGGAA